MKAAFDIKSGSARIRIHGELDSEKIKKATENYLKKVEKCKRKEKSVISIT